MPSKPTEYLTIECRLMAPEGPPGSPREPPDPPELTDALQKPNEMVMFQEACDKTKKRLRKTRPSKFAIMILKPTKY